MRGGLYIITTFTLFMIALGIALLRPKEQKQLLVPGSDFVSDFDPHQEEHPAE